MVTPESLVEAAIRLERHSEALELSRLLKHRDEIIILENTEAITVELSATPVLELGAEFRMPYPVLLRMIEEGTYKGVFLPAEEIRKAKDTMFIKTDDMEFNIIHWDHNNQFKEDASAKDHIGKITRTYIADERSGVLMGEGILSDINAAQGVHVGVQSRVSMRIVPRKIEYRNGMRIGRD